MCSRLTLCIVLGLASAAFGKDPKPYQTGTLLQMNSVLCGQSEDGMRADSSAKRSHEAVCQEYVLQADRAVYHIRPRDEKHSVILPVGERALFRLHKDDIILRAEDFTGKEREYVVVSISPRTDTDSADATPPRINHLQ